MESPSSYRVTFSSSRAFNSSAPSTYPRSASTFRSTSDRAFRSTSRASKDFWSAASVSARWTFTTSSPHSAAVARSAASSSAARPPLPWLPGVGTCGGRIPAGAQACRPAMTSWLPAPSDHVPPEGNRTCGSMLPLTPVKREASMLTQPVKDQGVEDKH